MKPKSKLIGSRSSMRVLAAAITSTFFFSASAQAVEATYQYFRFVPLESRGNNGRLLADPPPQEPNYTYQLSEFAFFHEGSRLNLNGTSLIGPVVGVSVYTGVQPNFEEEPDTETFEAEWGVADDDVTTKFLNYDGENGGFLPLVFRFDAPVTIDSYNFASANDAIDRLPRSWRLEGSADGVNYTLIDRRLGYEPYSDRETLTYQPGGAHTAAMQRGFKLPLAATLEGTPTDLSIGYFDNESIDSVPVPGEVAIIGSGEAITLYWTANGATSVTLEPGSIPLEIDEGGGGSVDVSPTETTTYTLVAQNESGTVTRDYTIQVVEPDSRNYRFVRFTALRLGAWDAVGPQIAEFRFYNGDTQVPVSSVTNPGGRGNAGEGVASLIDGNVATKWLDLNKGGEVVFDFGSSQEFDSYDFVTANDAPARTPVAWLIEGRNSESESWVVLDHVGRDNIFYPVSQRPGITTGKIKLPAIAPLVWEGTGGIAGWDTFGAETFSDGDWVLFDDSSEAVNIDTVGDFKPGGMIFDHSKDFFTVGLGLNGSGGLFKRGTGTLNLTTPSAFTGPIHVDGGRIVAGSPKSLGRSDSAQPLLLEPGTELSVTATQWSQRPLSMNGSTINVAEGVEFNHVGPIKLQNTVRKTGPGILRLYGLQGSTHPGRDFYQFLVEDGQVQFATDYFNRNFFAARSFFATATGTGVIAGAAYSSLGGDYVEAAVTIGQLRAEDGGTISTGGGIQYLPAGQVTTNGVLQGRIVLRGGTLDIAGQTESSRNGNTDGTLGFYSIISTEASAVTSRLIGSASLVLNPSFMVFDIADGEVADDLTVIAQISGGRGFIKQGAGNMLLLNGNSYGNVFADPAFTPLVDDLPHATTVREGWLTASNLESTTSATGPHPVLVEEAGTLAGTGFVAGNVDLLGTVEPGDIGFDSPIGILTLGSTNLSGTYVWGVNGAANEDVLPGIGGETGADRLAITGDLNLTGASLVVQPAGAGFTEESYVIATYTGTRTGEFASVTPGYAVSYDDVAGEITIVSDGSGPEPTAFDAFVAEFSLTGANATPGADPDGDGITNLIEFVLGSDPSASSLADAPTSTLDAEGNLVFTFRRNSESTYTNPSVEYSTSLSGDWTAAAAATVAVEANGFEAGVDRVTVTLPASLAVDGKLFARLTATL